MTRQPHALIATALLALLATATPHLALAADGHTSAHAQPASNSASAPLTDGEVRKIDMGQGKVTLKHGEIKHLDMPGMTMVFTVKDKAQLATLKAGDKVKFAVSSDNGKLVVTDILPAP